MYGYLATDLYIMYTYICVDLVMSNNVYNMSEKKDKCSMAAHLDVPNDRSMNSIYQ